MLQKYQFFFISWIMSAIMRWRWNWFCVVMIKSFEASHIHSLIGLWWKFSSQFYWNRVLLSSPLYITPSILLARRICWYSANNNHWMNELVPLCNQILFYGLCDKFRLIEWKSEREKSWMVQLNYCWIIIIIEKDKNKIKAKEVKRIDKKLWKKRILIMLHLVSMKNDFFCGQKMIFLFMLFCDFINLYSFRI